MDKNNVFDYIIAEENAWKTTRIPLTDSKDWNMKEHIERCFNVANGWFHGGKNDGMRPYKDVVTPIIDVAFRIEGFDVKDIVPFVDNIKESYKSFLVKKYHPKWARKHELDTFIDEVVESSIIYDLALVKDINNVRPELIPLQEIAFCDQTDVLAGPICLKHQYTIPDLVEFKGKWDADKIDELIVMSEASKEASMANDRTQATPGKYIEVYELHGRLPEAWLEDEGEIHKYKDQMHIVAFYKDSNGDKNGITLYKGKDRKITDIFKALKIDSVRSFGRACGRSVVERLFEPQVWINYSEIRIKELLDAAAVVLYQTDSDEFGNKKVKDLKSNTVLKHEPGRPITRMDTTAPNIVQFQNQQQYLQDDARKLGAASEAALGMNPVSGTPFALQNLITQQGEGIHTYRRGKIATFFADVLYRDLILKYLVKDMNNGVKFSEDLSIDELEEIADVIVSNEVEEGINNQIKKTGIVPTEEEREVMKEINKAAFMKKGSRRFFEVLENELKEIPIDVFVNVSGKQRQMAQNADKLSALLTNILGNIQGIQAVPGIGKAYNQLIEESGMNPIDFSTIINSKAPVAQPSAGVEAPQSVENEVLI